MAKVDFSKLVDNIYIKKQELKAINAVIAKSEKVKAGLKNTIKDFEIKMLVELNKKKLKGVRGQLASCSISPREAFKIISWTKFWGWMVKNDAGDCVEKRPVKSAIIERITKDNGKRKATPVGLEHSSWEELSVTKNPTNPVKGILDQLNNAHTS